MNNEIMQNHAKSCMKLGRAKSNTVKFHAISNDKINSSLYMSPPCPFYNIPLPQNSVLNLH